MNKKEKQNSDKNKTQKENKKQEKSIQSGQVKQDKIGERKKIDIFKMIKENSLTINVALVFIAVIFCYSWYISFGKSNEETNTLDEGKIEKRVTDFLKQSMFGPETDFEVNGVTMERDMYKMKLNVNGKDEELFVSKDGEVLFLSSVNMAEFEARKKELEKVGNVEVPKTDKPKIEVFVMSYCPYGTQVQKGLLPVVEKLAEKIDFEFKFVDYAMHGEKEIEENVRQYCINKKEPSKFIKYLSCFLKAGDSASCLKLTKIDRSILVRCSDMINEKFEVEKKFKDKSTWKGNYPPFDLHKSENEAYGVQGSPTLVINGVSVKSKRDPQSLLTTICNAFSKQPEQCQEKLSTKAPTSGFGEGEEGSSSGGSCN